MNPLAYLTAAGGAAIGAVLVWLFMSLVTVPNAAHAAREGYVLLAEKTAAEATAAEIERQRVGAVEALDRYRDQATADQKNLQVANENLETIIASDMASGGCTWSDDDINWLRAHGSTPK